MSGHSWSCQSQALVMMSTHIVCFTKEPHSLAVRHIDLGRSFSVILGHNNASTTHCWKIYTAENSIKVWENEETVSVFAQNYNTIFLLALLLLVALKD